MPRRTNPTLHGIQNCIYRPKRPFRGQLQRFVMTTIRVMAWPVRAKLTAHATKATPGKSLSVSYSELCCDFNKCPPTKPASIQFQRTPPTPSRPTTTTAICDSDNPRDGVACTYRAYRTCNKSDSWPKPFGIRLRAIVCFSKYPPSKPASIQF